MLIELTGQPDDPNCLHCYLAPLVHVWLTQHPDKDGTEVMIELAQVVGHIVASGLHNSGRHGELPQAVALCRRQIRHSAQELLDALKYRPPISPRPPRTQ